MENKLWGLNLIQLSICVLYIDSNFELAKCFNHLMRLRAGTVSHRITHTPPSLLSAWLPVVLLCNHIHQSCSRNNMPLHCGVEGYTLLTLTSTFWQFVAVCLHVSVWGYIMPLNCQSRAGEKRNSIFQEATLSLLHHSWVSRGSVEISLPYYNTYHLLYLWVTRKTWWELGNSRCVVAMAAKVGCGRTESTPKQINNLCPAIVS